MVATSFGYEIASVQSLFELLSVALAVQSSPCIDYWQYTLYFFLKLIWTWFSLMLNCLIKEMNCEDSQCV